MYLQRGSWKKPEKAGDENIVKEVVFQSISVNKVMNGEITSIPPQLAGIEITITPHLNEKIVEIEARGKIHEKQLKLKAEKAKVEIEISRRLCKTCSFKAAGRCEAILQLRGAVRDETMKNVKEALLEAIKSIELENPADFLVKVDEEAGGPNFYLGSLGLGEKLSELMRESGAKVTKTAKLIGQTKDGRRKYRVTFLTTMSEEAVKRLGKRLGFKA